MVLQNIKPVGYQAWADEKTVVVFVLGEPSTLQLVDVPTEKTEIVARNVGRSIHKVPGQARISFVHKVSADDWRIESLDIKTRQATVLTKTLPGKEDYAWTPDGTAIMGSGSKLFMWTPKRDGTWREAADFSAAGVMDITRLAVSPKGERVALVSSVQPDNQHSRADPR